MKGLARTLIALLVAAALFAAMALPALAAHHSAGDTSQNRVSEVAATASGDFSDAGNAGNSYADVAFD